MLGSVSLTREMIDDVRREQRSFATGISLVLFSTQYLVAALLVYVYANHSIFFADFSARFPGLTRVIGATSWLWMGVAVAVPFVALCHAYRDSEGLATAFSACCAVGMFVAAQIATAAVFFAYAATTGLSSTFGPPV